MGEDRNMPDREKGKGGFGSVTIPVTIGWRMEEKEETNKEKWIDKPIWDEENIKRYQEKLEEELENREDKIGWSELKEIIEKSMVTKRIKINRKIRRDEE